MKNLIFLLCLLNSNLIAQSKTDTSKADYYFNKSFQYGLFSQEHQQFLDSAIFYNHSNPYYWQQKSMPLSKMKKYELAMTYLDSAVKYDKTLHWREYRAFIKCIFQKSYRAAIEDFQFVKLKNENGNVMDHTFNFHIGLCYLQLNQFDSAGKYIQKSIEFRLNKWQQAHHLEYFYLGLVYMEQTKMEQAINQFDLALKLYSQFPDVLYYKGKILKQQGKVEEAKNCFDKALESIKNGYTINEDNAIYEEYPYQIKNYWLEK